MRIRLLNRILLVAFLTITFGANVFAQQKSSLQKITLNEHKQPISHIFNTIMQKTGLKFSYSPQIIDENKMVSVNISDASIEEVLAAILEENVSCKIIGKHIVLMSVVPSPVNINPVTPSPDYFVAEKLLTTESDINLATSSPSYPVIDEVMQTTSPREILQPIKIFDYKSIGKIEIDCLTHITKINEEEMKKHLMTFLLASVMIADTIIAQEVVKGEKLNSKQTETESGGTRKIMNFSLVYPLGSDWVNSAKNEYNFSLSLIGGVTGKTKGVEMAPVFNVNRYGVKGLQMAAGFNLASASSCICDGVQKNNFVEEGSNVQLAAVFNYNGYGKSTQFAAGFNIADKAPLQASAVANIAKEAPVQLTAGLNYTKDNKAQISALTNIADTTKAQITALLNVAKDSKFQLGVINVTKKGKFQLGVVNVRDTADGVSLGLINVGKGGVMEFGIEAGEFILAAATFRSGIKPFYSILSVGWTKAQIYAGVPADLRTRNDNMLAIGYGLGSAVRLYKKLDLNMELMVYNLIHISGSASLKYPNNQLFRFAPYLNYTFSKHFKVFAGPTFNLLHATYNNDLSNAGILVPYSIFSRAYMRENNFSALNFWIGGTVGIKF